jgi:hypothetical protein
MSVSASDVKEYAPELAAVADTRVDKFIAYALLRINPSVWGDLADLATILLAAHMLTRTGNAPGGGSSGARGAITQESVGDLSRSYEAPAGASSVSTFESGLAATPYGLEYIELRKTMPVIPMVVCQ